MPAAPLGVSEILSWAPQGQNYKNTKMLFALLFSLEAMWCGLMSLPCVYVIMPYVCYMPYGTCQGFIIAVFKWTNKSFKNLSGLNEYKVNMHSYPVVFYTAPTGAREPSVKFSGLCEPVSCSSFGSLKWAVVGVVTPQTHYIWELFFLQDSQLPIHYIVYNLRK